MPEPNQAVCVQHRIAAKLGEVPLERAPAPSPEEQACVKTNGARVQQAEPPAAQAPGAVGLTLWVDPDLEEWEPGLERACRSCRGGERNDDNPRWLELRLPLSQLRQVLFAGESTEISQEDQDGWPATKVLHAASVTAEVGETEMW